MKSFKYLVVLGCLFGQMEANELYGTKFFKNERVNFIEGNGFYQIEKTHVEESVCINGFLKADSATIKDLMVNGKTELTSCVINGTSKINGSLAARDSTFKGDIEVSSEKVTLIHCSLNSLKMGKFEGFKGSQRVELKNCQVIGNITFEAGKGEVILHNCQCNSEQIIGGLVIK